MARELFKAVQNAEEQAEQLIQEAQRKARELLKTTEGETTERERKIAMELRVMYQTILDNKRAEFEQTMLERKPAIVAAQLESLAQVRNRLGSVAQQIFERVWNDGNR